MDFLTSRKDELRLNEDGTFTDGDALGAVPASVDTADWNNAVGKEIVNAIEAMGLTPDELAFDQLGKALKKVAGVGRLFPHFGEFAPVGAVVAAGSELNREVYADLWGHVSDPANSFTLISDADWLAGRIGCYSTGDGSTTFRLPELRAEYLRFIDADRGVDPALIAGQWFSGQSQDHTHADVLVQSGSSIQVSRGNSTGFSGENLVRAVGLLPCINV